MSSTTTEQESTPFTLTSPTGMHVGNKDNFKTLYIQKKLADLKSAVFDNMLLRDETDYFDLGTWAQRNLHPKKKGILSGLTMEIVKELTSLGWTCKLSFNDTGLFIFADASKPPKNYFPGSTLS
jgi:hypothetical protein